MKALAPNTLIQNRYLVIQLVGKGGMGEVYLAVDQRLGSAVALKRTYFAADEMLGNAFEREAKILARLRHPVLPKVSDHFTENEEQYLVMEHIAGDDLSKRLDAAQKPFPLSWVMFWADQLLDALSYLHSHEPPIIHRDIKPQNLKLTDENHIVLLDFGLSKNSSGQTHISRSGTSGSVVGYTPHYAPMEQIRGTGTSPKSDIYALSATLYQLMSNEVPADALTRADALLNGSPDPIRPLPELNPEIPKVVSDVILKGMEVSQEKRFAKAGDMQKALRKAFTNMQEAMTAQTIAFSAVTDQGMFAEPAEPIHDDLAMDSRDLEESEMPTRVPRKGDQSSAVSEPIRQSDVATEVFSAADVDWNSIDTSGTDGPGPSAAPEPEFLPDETIPVMDFEKATGRDKGMAVPVPAETFESGNGAGELDPFATFTPAHNIAAAAGLGVSQPTPSFIPKPAPAAPAKRSRSMMVLGGAGIFALLVILAAGAGWYAYNNYSAASTADAVPSPSPEEILQPSPSPAPTLEAAVSDANSIQAPVNGAPDSNTNANTSEILTVTPETSNDGSARQAAPSTPKRPTRTSNAPARTATPKPKAGDRTVILQ